MMFNRVPYSLVNYETLVEKGCYFIDKTSYIRNLENYLCPVFLRPRRFGKSLWCSILECYYDIARAQDFDRLFGKTAIGRDPTPYRNSSLVLKLNFSTVKVSDRLEEIEKSFDWTFANALDEFVRHYETYFGAGDEILSRPNATEQLKKLVSVVKREGHPRLFVIVDEYDNFTNQLLASLRDADYTTLTTADSFLRTFFKTLKFGLEDGVIRSVFLTGVLPVTLDDLTSGFNVGKNISLRPEFVNMAGFTSEEVVGYVDRVFADYGFDDSLKPRVLADMKAYYDGYRFAPMAGTELYNSTICNNYLHDLVANGGRLPDRVVDTNVKPDVAWLAVMSRKGATVEDLILRLLGRNEAVSVSADKVNDQISAGKFFSSELLPVCLYYLGLLTFADEFSLRVPNLSVKRVLLDYYQEIHAQTFPALSNPAVATALRSFVADRSWRDLFQAFWDAYIKRILPAKLFSYVNECFFQVLFFGFCLDNLSGRYSIRIEENHFSGQSDFIAVPLPGESADIEVLEFKYVSKVTARKQQKDGGEAKLVAEAMRQLAAYVENVRLQNPGKNVRGSVVLIVGNLGPTFYPLEGQAVNLTASNLK